MEALSLTFANAQGNKFVIVDGKEIPFIDPNSYDQLILIDFPTIRFFNRDGSESSACGNGTRAAAYYWFLKTKQREITFINKSEKFLFCFLADDGDVCVNMGLPQFCSESIPSTQSDLSQIYSVFQGSSFAQWIQNITFMAIDMGNPHLVLIDKNNHIETLKDFLKEFGHALEHHSFFPNRTNVEIVQIISPSHLNMVVWERGVGLTEACGTGACASLVAVHLNKMCERKATVSMPGGDVIVSWKDDGVYLQGSVFIYDV